MELDKVREAIVLISKKDGTIKKLVKRFNKSEMSEEELIVSVINELNTQLNNYKDEEERIDLITW
ncbi:hypothetical protein [Escherichia fergusonii]|uniref:hypothetical protein n=1 Tax=Escherichia fergusonii TaxID=564 RepID=UPI0015E51669|nr:hypothetical protein [Escherichia fergusonii]EHP6126696.1 hypothetical protein [Escherichia coli]EHJ4142145.1 hypothetical protein [Escherichia fergusonii]EJU9823599.1 hypothetical protein [Escherichia coli]MBA8579765.1 hypothetical protein [Escherichia fergusonii]QLM34132.1 hypothetical protein HVV65_07160 [Escherichia fergusonii]